MTELHSDLICAKPNGQSRLACGSSLFQYLTSRILDQIPFLTVPINIRPSAISFYFSPSNCKEMDINARTAADRLRSRKPVPKPVPAYLPSAGSPLTVPRDLYETAQKAPRVLVEEFVLPIRSGRAWKAPAGSIVRISTPEGPQVGKPTSSSEYCLQKKLLGAPCTKSWPIEYLADIPSCAGDLNIWNAHNPRERFWASRTKQLHASHVTTHDRLWSCLPYMRPLVTIIADSLSWYGEDEHGGRVHDLLGTRCDPYINTVLSGQTYDFHCHSNLTRAVAPFGLNESDVHDVINLFQVTGLDEKGRYFMNPCPAEAGDHIEFLAEQDVLMALSEHFISSVVPKLVHLC